MMSQAIRFLSAFSIATGTVLLAASCSLPLQRQIEPAGRTRADQAQHSRKIAQLNFGRDASFAVCVEPACPAVTRKTLAIKQQVPANAIPPSVDIAATLDPGEVELKVRHDTEVAPVPPTEHLRASVIVTFASGSAALDQAASGVRAAASTVIAGRTDKVGSKSTNQALALARARAVRDYLRSRLPSYPSRAFTLDAQGTCCFTASNDTPEGRRQNRRVEVVFSVPGQVAP